MIRVSKGLIEFNGDATEIMGEFVMVGMQLKRLLNELDDSTGREILLGEFQADLIKMYKYGSPEEFIAADERGEDINIRELFGLED